MAPCAVCSASVVPGTLPTDHHNNASMSLVDVKC
jgi:hypothetical protein